MGTKTTLRIAEPCHENWDKMTSTEKGRFCQACSKQVVDFSLLSDRQILEYFSKQKGNTCGRLRDDQLNRPLDNQQAKAKVSLWKWFMTVGFGLWFNNKAVSQTGKLQKKSDSKTQTLDAPPDVVYVGMVASEEDKEHVYQRTHKSLQIKGTVVNNAGEPLAGASLSLKGKAYKVSATDGTFSINAKVPISKDSVELSFSSIGYETKNVKVLSANKKDMLIEMTPKAIELKEVVVTGYGIQGKVSHTVGEVSSVRSTTLTRVVDSVKRFTAKTLDKALFKTYPNPVPKGSFVNITVKDEGTYSLQLISNASQLISSQKIDAVKGQFFQLQISSSLASGIYYLRMVNEETGKLYTDKVVVL